MSGPNDIFEPAKGQPHISRVYSASPWGDLSGAPLCALEHVKLMRTAVADVCLVLAHCGPLRNRAEREGVRTECWAFECRGLRRAGLGRLIWGLIPVLRSRWRYVWHLKKKLKQEPGILHIHSRGGASAYSLVAGIWARVPMVLTLHEFPNQWRWYARRDAWVMRHFVDAIVAVSNATAQAYRSGLRGHPLRVVGNVVEMPREPIGRSRDGCIVALVGQLGTHKGYMEFLEMCGILHARGVRFKAWLVGAWRSPEEREQGENFLHQSGILDKVVFCGVVEDMDRIYRRINVLVMPTHAETFGRVALEAMAYGVPVVASQVEALSELVEDGKTGYLVPKGDVNAFAARTERLLLDAELRQTLGNAGRAKAKRLYSPGAYIEAMLEIYRGLANAPRSGRD